MKGLFYNHLDKKELAYEFVKKGIRHDMKSHICKETLSGCISMEIEDSRILPVHQQISLPPGLTLFYSTRPQYRLARFWTVVQI
jgi:hypothetical protein